MMFRKIALSKKEKSVADATRERNNAWVRGFLAGRDSANSL